jgi:hypothetical protein
MHASMTWRGTEWCMAWRGLRARPYQVRRGGGGDEELRAVRARARVEGQDNVARDVKDDI